MNPTNQPPVTLINVFELTAERVDEFIEQWRERAGLLATKPGFVDARLHRALSTESRFQLITVAHWVSRGAWQAATADPGFQQRTEAVSADARMLRSADPALYEVAVELIAPSR